MLKKDKKLLYFSTFIFIPTQNVQQKINFFKGLQNFK